MTPLAAVLGGVVLAVAAGAQSPGGALPPGPDPNLRGQALFEVECAGCHGMTGQGDGPLAIAFKTKPHLPGQGVRDFDANGNGTPGEDADAALVIRNGAAAFGGSPQMRPQGQLSDEQIESLIAYIRELIPPVE